MCEKFYGMVHPEDLENKVIFWGVDGVLAPFRFNDHIAPRDGIGIGLSKNESREGFFVFRKPSRLVQNIVDTCEAKSQYAASQIQYKEEEYDKRNWLCKHYPALDGSVFVLRGDSKVDAIIAFCDENGIDLADAVLIDDYHKLLVESEQKGLHAYHVSSLMDWDYILADIEFAKLEQNPGGTDD